MGDLPRWKNNLIVMGSTQIRKTWRIGRVVMGDLPRKNVGLIVMGDLPKEKGKSGLIVMGDLLKWKNGLIVMGDLPR
jgi:hypothetical protein